MMANGRDGSAQSGALGALGALRATMAAADAELKRTLHELTERTRTLAAEMTTHAQCRTELARQETELVQTRRSLADEARARTEQETELHGTIKSLNLQLADWTAAMERTRSELLKELAATQRVPDTSDTSGDTSGASGASGAGVAAAGPAEPSGTSEPSAAPAGPVVAPAPAAQTGTVETPAPSGPVEAPVPARFAYTLTPNAGVSVTLCAVVSEAGFDNSVGHYFADADGSPICGRIDFTNAKKSIGSSVTVNYAAEDLAGLAGLAGLDAAALRSVGLFIVPNGKALNALVPDNARVTFARGVARNGRSEWEARYNGEPVRGDGAAALFSDDALNPDGSAHTTNEACRVGRRVGFEDLSGFGGRSDNHYRDVVVDVRVADFAPAGEAGEAAGAPQPSPMPPTSSAGEAGEAGEGAGAPQPSPMPPPSSAGEAAEAGEAGGAPQTPPPSATPETGPIQVDGSIQLTADEAGEAAEGAGEAAEGADAAGAPTTAGGDVSSGASGAPPTIEEVDGHIQVTVGGQAAPVFPNRLDPSA